MNNFKFDKIFDSYTNDIIAQAKNRAGLYSAEIEQAKK